MLSLTYCSLSRVWKSIGDAFIILISPVLFRTVGRIKNSVKHVNKKEMAIFQPT